MESSASAFDPYLNPGEKVLWSGQPRQGTFLTGRDAFLIPFSLMFGAFAIFWNYGVWTMGGDGDAGPGLLFRLWGLPFLVAGLYFIFGRFIHDAYLRSHVLYGVSNQRVLILRGRQANKLTSLDIRRLTRLDLDEHRDGTGTLAFENTSSGYWGNPREQFNWWLPSRSSDSQFFHIADPRAVYDLVRTTAYA